MIRILRGLGWLLLVVVALVAVTLAEAHWEMSRIAPALPAAEDLLARLETFEGPVRIGYSNTASQSGGAPAVLGHPAFLLEWSDGRSLLVDAGMDREAALAFGRLGEVALGSDPIVPHGSVARQLGGRVHSLSAVMFTHLHDDHTQGLLPLCEARGAPLVVLQTAWQADRGNFGTAPGRGQLEEASCAQRVALEAESLVALPELPGVVAFAAGGHTPGSTVFVARVAGHVWVLAGDIANFRANLDADRAKPLAYSLLFVPENRSRLAALRAWLRELDARPGWTVVLSHDLDALEASGMSPVPRS